MEYIGKDITDYTDNDDNTYKTYINYFLQKTQPKNQNQEKKIK